MSKVFKNNPQQSKLILEELEERRLFSGGIEGLIVTDLDSEANAIYSDVDGSTTQSGDTGTDAAAAEQQSQEIVFVDADVDNYQQLVDDIRNNTDSNRNIEVVVLDRDKDGIEEISEFLSHRDDLDAIHIISHGSDGSVELGNTSLNADSLEQNNLKIALWANSFTEAGDILIYGCNLAETGAGQSLINDLSALTLTDVAASTDLTGDASQGGDWALEFSVGKIESEIAVSDELQQEYQGTFATYTVTSLADSGAGSLREAVTLANTSGGADTIEFGVAGTINLSSALPTIDEELAIDGSAAPGYSGDPVVNIDGSGVTANGLHFTSGADNSSVNALMITNFTGNGIQIDSGADGISITGNWIGTTGTGTTGDGNTNNGINVQGANTVIGGTGVNDGNVITNNGNEGINLMSGATGTIIQGNIIGLDPDGSTGTGNGDVGIALLSGADNTTIGGTTEEARNIISMNYEGIEINSNNNTVQGNYIGTDITGTLDRGNDSDDGIEIQNNATGNLIGGTDPGAGNLIAFNDGNGVNLVSGSNNTVLGNQIYSNGGQNIYLASGANSDLSAPTLTTAQISSNQITVSGTLSSTPNSYFRIEFFGANQTYLGFINVATDGSGNASYDATLNANVASGASISASATESDASYTTFTDTSALSASVSAANSGTAIWGDGSTTPQTSTWDGTVFSATTATAPTGDYRIMQGAEAPTRDEIIIVGVDSSSEIVGEMWDGSSWSTLAANPLGTVSQSYWWSMDVAYEQQSGDAVMVWADGSELMSSVWDGSNWTTPIVVHDFVTSDPRQIQLAAQPNGDEMVMVVSDSNGDDTAWVWDGSSWGSPQVLDTTGGYLTSVYVAYEQQSGDALVTYAKSGDANVYYQVWDGTSWSAEASVAPPDGMTPDANWVTLGSDPGSDRIAMGVVTSGGTAADIWLSVWNGSTWEASVVTETTATGSISPNVAVAFESTSGQAIAVYGENSSNSIRYATWDSGSGWSAEQTGPDVGGVPNSVMLAADPISDQIMLTVQDASSDVNAILWDGSSWGTPTELGTNTTETKNQPFLYLWDQSSDQAEVTTSFQQGVNGYTGTQDTFIDEFEPTTDKGNEVEIAIDLFDGASDATTQGLINFDNIFGSGAGQIPVGSAIISAELTVNVINESAGGAQISLHQMLTSWTESSTWDSFSLDGIQTDGIEAASTADSTLASPELFGPQTFSGLEDTLQSWSDGAANHGWVIVSDSTNGWDFSSSEVVTVTDRPILTVNFTAPTGAPVITSDGGTNTASVNVAENTTAVTTVTATDAELDSLTYSIDPASDDNGFFTIDSSSGVLAFITAPNFETAADLNGDNVYEVTVKVDDGNGGVDTQAISVTVTNVDEVGINDAPLNSVPSAQTIDRDGIQLFSPTTGTAISISDVDAGTSAVQVTLNVSNGTLNLSGTQGLSFSVGDGSDDSNMTFTGTIDDINAALEGATFVATPGFTGVANLQIITNDLGNTGTGGALSDTDNISITVQAPDQSLWLTFKDDIATGNSEIANVTGGDIVTFGDITQLETSNSNPLASTTSGTMAYGFNLDTVKLSDGFAASDGNTIVNAVHYVSSDIQVGSNNIQLQAGDVLMSTHNDETIDGVTYQNDDLFVFRPDTAGDYSQGSFFLLIDGNAASLNLNNLTGISLVEQTTTVGGVTLNPGEFLFSHGGDGKNILHYTPGTLGTTTTGTTTVLIAGADIDIGQDIGGLHLVQADTVIGDQTLSAGQLMVSIQGEDSAVGNGSSIDVNRQDIFVLDVTATGVGTTAATATRLFEGLDENLDAGNEAIFGIGYQGNVAPTVNADTFAIDENSANSTVVGSVTATDLEPGTLNYAIIGGNTDGAFTINITTGEITVANSAVLDFETTSTFALTVAAIDAEGAYGTETITVNLNNLDEAGVNDAPENSIPSTQTIDKDGIQLFSSTTATAISVSDFDAGSAVIQITLNATNGSFNLSGFQGLSFSLGDGTADADMTFTGTIADINAALEGATFVATPGFTGVANLQIITNDLGNTGTGGALSDTDNIAITVQTPDQSLWLTFKDDIATGNSEIANVSGGDIVTFGDITQLETSNSDPLASTTSGTMAYGFNLDTVKLSDGFAASDGNTIVNAVHYVSSDIQVGSNNIQLQAGDVLMSTHADESIDGVTYQNDDLFVFRPDTPGDYSQGSFFLLIDGNAASLNLNNLTGISLVEQTTTVGGVTLNPGEFLFSHGGDGRNIQHYTPGTLGATTTGTATVLIAGNDINISQDIGGLHLVQADTVIGDQSLSAGQLLVSIQANDSSVGDTPVIDVKLNDIFVLDVTATGDGTSAATATRLFEGLDENLDSGNEAIWGIGYQGNVAPTVNADTFAIDENSINATVVGSITASDAEPGALNYAITDGNIDGAFAIDPTSGQITVANSSALDFETTPVFTLTVAVIDSMGAYDTATITVNLNDLVENAAPTDLVTTGTASGGVALNEDGGNDVYYVADDGGGLLDGLTAVTIEASFSISTPATGPTTLLSYADGAFDEELGLFIQNDGTIIFGAHAAASPFQLSTSQYTELFDGEKHQVSVSWDSSTGAVDLYIDGQHAESFTGYQTGHTITGGGELIFGQDQDSVLGGFTTDNVFSGTLYDVRIFDDVRTVGEIGANYDQTLPNTEAGMIANWTFNDLSTGGVITDSVSGNNLTEQHVVAAGFSTSVAELSLQVAENAANGTVVGSVATIDPNSGDTFTYSLQDDAGGRFAINASTGQITVADGSLLDFETASSHNITVRTTDAGGLTYDEVFAISVTNVNEAPVVTSDGGQSSASINVAENTTAITTVTATDVDLDTPTFTISGGVDQGLFSIDLNSGLLTFDTAPDFENPGDVGADNTYVVEVTAADGNGGFDVQTITVQVTNAADGIRVTPLSVVPLGGETLVNTNTTDNQMISANVSQAVATDASGNYVIVWGSNLQDGSGWGIFAQQYNADGTTQGSEFLVNTVSADNQLTPSVAMDAAGNFTIVWQSNLQDGDSSGVYAQQFNAAGVAQGTEFLVNTTTAGYQGSPGIAMAANGDFVINWVATEPDTSLGTYAQLFNASGVAQGGEIHVNTYTAGHQQATSVAMSDQGNFVITWASQNQDGSNYGVFGQLFDASGNALGAEFQVNTTTVNSQLYNDVAMLADGRFVVEYQSRNADGSFEVYMQRYDANGTAVGSEIQVNTTTVSSAQQPIGSITADDSGNITVVWNNDADGDGTAVVGRSFDWDGNPLSAEFQINSTVTGNQLYPEVVALPGGGFIAVWGGEGTGDADGVYSQRYGLSTDEDGGTTSFQVVLESAPSSDVTIPISVSDGSEGSVSLGSLTFNSGNWNIPQFITVTGIQDFILDGDQTYTVNIGPVTSADLNFNGLDPADLTIINLETNAPPVITSDGGGTTASINVVENTTAVTTVTATDVDLDTPTYTITGGADQGLFSIDLNSGVLTFDSTPDFETPGDVGANNTYEVQITAADGLGGTDVQTITVNVTNIGESPVFGGADTGAVQEDVAVSSNNISTSGTLTIADPDTGESSFQAATINGTYGDLVMQTNGNWTYTADNTQAAIQQLDVSESLTDTLTVTSFDGTTHNVVITINGSEDAAVISGTTTGSVTEDGTLTSSGLLTISDTDTSDTPSFADVGVTAGDNNYGTFEMTAGTWTYTLDNNNAAVQALDVGETLSDTFIFTASDGSPQLVTVTINGAEDTPVFDSTAITAATEDLAYSYTITTSDVDIEAVTITAPTLPAWLTLVDNGNGTATLSGTPSNAEVGNHNVVLNVSDGTLNSNQNFTITVANTNDAAVIAGVDTGAVQEDVAVVANNISTGGLLTIADPDIGESSFQAGTSVGTYGSLTIDTAGNWTYTADNTQAAIQQLDALESITDTLTVTSFDGTTHNVVITINGSEDAAVITGTTTGSVTEDGTLTSSGLLTISDTDTSDSPSFADVGVTTGDNVYGTFAMTTGTWTYTLNNTHPAVQGLDVGETLSDTHTFTATDGSTQQVTVTINGAEDTPVFDSSAITVATEDLAYSYTITTSDIDIESVIITAPTLPAWLTFVDNGDGTATLSGTPTNAEVGNHNVVLNVSDGTLNSNQNFTITVANTNDAAVIAGVDTGAVQEDVAVVANNISTGGLLTIADPDIGESSFQAGTSVGTYGSLTIDTAGNWTYTADNTQAAIQQLDALESITDTLTVTSFDGTTHNVVITINGSEDAAVISGTTTGSVTEDGTLTSSGALTISDTDTSDSPSFADVGVTTGDNVYGTFAMTTGTWTYTLNNTHPAVQGLDVGETLSDTHTFTANDGSTQEVTITINGAEDTPVFDSTAVTASTEDLAYSYTITTSDIDIESVIITAPTLPAWLTFVDNGDGTATLSGTPTNAEVGNHNVVLNVSDGTLNSNQNFTITVANTNDAAVIAGVDTGAVQEDVAVVANNISTGGLLTIADPDIGESSFQAGPSVGTYGSLTIDTAGNWTYTADNTQAAIQQLDALESITDTLTVTSFDGTTHNVVITINGSEDAAVISGTTTGSVTEDGTLTSSGALTISDTDTSDSPSFADVPSTAGDNGYGSFIMTAGTWTYTLDNNSAAVQALDTGETLSDTHTFTATDGSPQLVTVTINGAEDTPVFDSTAITAATEDLAYSYTITTSDVDIEAVTITAPTLPAWLTLVDNGNGTATLSGTPSNAEVGNHNVVLNVSDGTLNSNQNFTITVANTNDAAVIAGVDTGAVQEDVAVVANNISTGGLLTIADPDIGESSFQAGTSVGTYGSLTIDTAGNWTYTADNTQAAIQQLDALESITDTLTVTSFDGTTHNVVITINGSEDAAVITGTTTGSVTEDGTLTSSGLLTISDTDTSDSPSFADVGVTTGDNVYGTFAMTTGTWTYTLNNTHPAVQGLDVGETLSDTHTFTATDGSTQQVTVTINGDEDAPVFDSTAIIVATEDVAYSYTITTSDVDVEAVTITAPTLPAWLTLVDNGNGTATLSGTPSNAEVGNHNVVLNVSDGTLTSNQNFTITVANTNDAAVIAGVDTGAVQEDLAVVANNITTTGLLTIADPDTGESTFQAGPSVGTYGSLTIDTAGNWTYTADNTQAAIQQLDALESITDTLTVTSFDGTTHNVVITINGSEDAAVITGTTVGSVAEDGSLISNGTLTITDTDSSDNPISFNDLASSPGVNGYGNFAITGNVWSFTLNNSHASVQALDVGETLSDSFSFTASDGSTQVVTITINGAEDAPTLDNAVADQTATEGSGFGFAFAANTFGDLDATDTLTYTATLSDSSPLPAWLSFDGLTRTFSGTPGIGDAGAIDIRITADDGSSSITDTFTLTIDAADYAPLIGGVDSGQVSEDQAVSSGKIATAGTLTIADPNVGESSFIGTTVNGALGALTIDTAGNWRYSADNGNPEIQALQSGESITDTLTVTTADGSTHNVVITINGAAEAPPTPPPPVEPPTIEPPPEVDPPPVEEEIVDGGAGQDPIVDEIVRAPQDVTPPPVQEEVDNSSYLQQEQAEADKAETSAVTEKYVAKVIEQPRIEAIQQQNLSLDALTLQVSDDAALNEKYELELLTRIDSMHSGMDGDAAQTSADDVEVQIVMGSTASLTAGIVSWVLRGGSLLASFMSTVPLLNRFDPLPILKSREEKEDVEEDTDDDDADTKFKKHQKRVDKLFSAKDNAREQNRDMNE